jgi:hypothetical protein
MDERPPKLLHATFDQRQGTPDSELRSNPVRLYARCQCVDRAFDVSADLSGPDVPAGAGTSPLVIALKRFRQQHPGERLPRKPWVEPEFHRETQGGSQDGWQALEAYIEEVASRGGDEFNPRTGIGSERWEQLVTLPPSIRKLQSVTYFALYGSHLVRIPPEIGELANLEELDPYTSYSLHWFPYEITRCPRLKRSRVSTRALYGNRTFWPPFPRLPCVIPEILPASCSVCRGPFTGDGILQVWISLRVATDVLPLLVNACSQKCIQKLPKPAEGYVAEPHQGGLEIKQPPPTGI